MKKRPYNYWIVLVTLMMLVMNFGAAHAQQMLIQIVGGGYRFDGPSQIVFSPVIAQFAQVDSEVSVRDITSGGYRNPPGGGEDGFVSIADQNGGAAFQVEVDVTGPLTHTTIPTYTIPLTNFQVKNVTTPGNSPNDVDILNGLSDGLELVPALNSYTDLSTARILATGTGQQPGEWKFYPGFRVQIPSATAIGTYETTITFTII